LGEAMFETDARQAARWATVGIRSSIDAVGWRAPLA
jgi:hypothetical protein